MKNKFVQRIKKIMTENVVFSIGLILLVALFSLKFFSAVFYDWFGLIVFVFLFVAGTWMLATRKETPNWVAVILVVIGLLGLIVDGWSVISNYIFHW